jgi:hypothetical protein
MLMLSLNKFSHGFKLVRFISESHRVDMFSVANVQVGKKFAHKLSLLGLIVKIQVDNIMQHIS